MADVNIMPQTVLLTSGQAATFTATDAANNPLAVNWSLNPLVGGFAPPALNTTVSSAVYVALPLVVSAQTLAVIATDPATNKSASARICLTPDAVVVVPAKVDLRATQSQQFVAIVAGAPPVVPPPKTGGGALPAAGGPAAGGTGGGVPGAIAGATIGPAAGAGGGAPGGTAGAGGGPAAGAGGGAPGGTAGAAGGPAAGGAGGGAPGGTAGVAGGPAAGAGGGTPGGTAGAAGGPAAGGPGGVQWVISPQLGTLEDQSGLYTAPNDITEPATVTITATTNGCSKQASAIINLVPPPWKGWGVNLLGAYLLLVFSLVYLLIGLWPPTAPTTPEQAVADRRAAETALQGKADSLKAAQAAEKSSFDEAQAAAAAVPKDAKKAQDAKAAADKEKADSEALTRALGDYGRALTDLNQKREIETQINDPKVHTYLAHNISRDIDLLFLVLLGGALGSFLHTARSYSEFIGNRAIRSSWAWWYCLHPFIGAGLALLFYAAARGGFMAVSNASAIKASDLNPFGVVALAGLVGMFSKAATTKLGDVFNTLFQSAKAGESKDKLSGSAQASAQPAANAPTASGGGGIPATTGAKPANQ